MAEPNVVPLRRGSVDLHNKTLPLGELHQKLPDKGKKGPRSASGRTRTRVEAVQTFRTPLLLTGSDLHASMTECGIKRPRPDGPRSRAVYDTETDLDQPEPRK